MPRLRTIPRLAWVALLLVLVVGGGIRLYQAQNPQPKLSQDALSYTGIAQNIAKRGEYTGRTKRGPVPKESQRTGAEIRRDAEIKALHWPPFTPHVFALAYSLTPGDHPSGRFDVRPLNYAQWAISTGTILAAFALGWVLVGAWTGVAGAAVVALYPPLAWGPSSLLSEPLGAFFVTCAFTALTLAWRTRRRPWWATAGALFGAVLLTRTDLLFVPILCALLGLVVVGTTQSWRRGAQSAALLALGLVVVVAPWTIYASGKSGSFVPVTTGGGSALFVGTFLPGNGSTFDMKFALKEEVVERHPIYKDRPYTTIPAQVVLDDIAARHPELERDAALSKEAKENLKEYALGDPLDFGKMMLFKAAKMWTRYARGGFDHTSPVWTTLHIVLVLLSAFGLVWGVVRRRDPALASIGLGILVATGVHTLAVAHGRYNLPLMPILLVAGCAGWTMAIREWRGARRSRAAGPDGPPPAPPGNVGAVTRPSAATPA
jgi:4-amino-4-deoxy-L-arabinose transferase-like glycosyltransferase